MHEQLLVIMAVRGAIFVLFIVVTAQKLLEQWKAKANYKDNEGNLCNAWSLKCINQWMYFVRKKGRHEIDERPRPAYAYKNGGKSYVGLLLLLCGDIETNPGPCTVTSEVLGRQDVSTRVKESKKKDNDVINITDLQSIISGYKINMSHIIPPAHITEQTINFEGEPYLLETTNFNKLPALIFATYQIIYQGLGGDENYLVNW